MFNQTYQLIALGLVSGSLVVAGCANSSQQASMPAPTNSQTSPGVLEQTPFDQHNAQQTAQNPIINQQNQVMEDYLQHQANQQRQVDQTDRARVIFNDPVTPSLHTDHQHPQDEEVTQADSTTEVTTISTPQADSIPSIPEDIQDLESMIQQALDMIHASENSPYLQRALHGAMLSVIEPDVPMDWRLMEELPPTERELVTEYHRFLTALNDRMVEEGAFFDAQSALDEISGLLDQQPEIQIQQYAICESVDDFGMYTELDQQAFLSGQNNPFVLYLELNGFTSEPLPNGQYEVRLTEEVALYHDTDDMLVWEMPSTVWTDLCQSRRRDFYLAHIVNLPERLSVGRYRMKVTIIDHHSGTFFDQTIPIEIVAHEGLASGERSGSDWGSRQTHHTQ